MLLTDIQETPIRDFIDDLEKMGHFKRVIVKKMDYYIPDAVYDTFSKTFKAYEKADTVLKAFSELQND